MTDFIISTIQTTGYAGILMFMFVENLFPPIPSEIIVPFAGFVAAQGELWFPGVLVAATVGSVLGALPWYALGVWFDEARLQRLAARYGRWFTFTPRDMERAAEWFHRYGAASVFFGRMIPTIRTLISAPAGSVRMPMATFLLLTTLGSAIWVTLLGVAGLILEANYHWVAGFIEPITWAVIVFIVATYVYRWIRFDPSR